MAHAGLDVRADDLAPRGVIEACRRATLRDMIRNWNGGMRIARKPILEKLHSHRAQWTPFHRAPSFYLTIKIIGNVKSGFHVLPLSGLPGTVKQTIWNRGDGLGNQSHSLRRLTLLYASLVMHQR